jgi:hypothetical protein
MADIIDINSTIGTTIKEGEPVTLKTIKYLPITRKHALIEATIQESTETEIINPTLLRMYFGINVVLSYTDIQPTQEQIIAPGDFYDLLFLSNVIQETVDQMNPGEYDCLTTLFNETLRDQKKYMYSTRGVLDTLATYAETATVKVSDFVSNLDPEMLKSLIPTKD